MINPNVDEYDDVNCRCIKALWISMTDLYAYDEIAFTTWWISGNVVADF